MLTGAILFSLVCAPNSGLTGDRPAGARGIAGEPPTPTVASSAAPDDPRFAEQWALDRLHAAALWSRTTGSPAILVAILDTGVDADHEDLQGKVLESVNFTGAAGPDDRSGHGTHVAGIIAAERNNGVGISGLAPGCRLLNVKVADDDGTCRASAVARGIRWATDHGARVINISLELRDPSPDLAAAVDYAWDRGAVIVAAAGNDASDSLRYPAAYPNCIAVGAIGPDDDLAPLSNYGDWVDLAAPGYQIFSTLPDNDYGYESGTSFAAAHASGLAALLFSLVTDTNGDGHLNDEVRAALDGGCRPLDSFGLGRGLIDATRLVPR